MATETVRNLPAQFVEDLGKDLATQITAQTAVPVVTRGIGSLTQQAGEDSCINLKQDKMQLHNLELDKIV